MIVNAPWNVFNPAQTVASILEAAPSVHLPTSVAELVEVSTGGPDRPSLEVAYELPDGRRVVEASVARVRNGIAANYVEPYMRRRDPDCMLIADEGPTDKPRFRDRFGRDFEPVRQETFDWLKRQELSVFGFHTGRMGMGKDSLVIAPANAGFFALGLALLQGIIPPDEIPENFDPKNIIYVAPVFRHTHFAGKQVVVHDRRDGVHEMFSYNLYPGPSAKKGVYGMLIGQGEAEGWVTAHCSTVQVVTPYDNIVTIMHEGASGGGKSEMLEQPHRLSDGRLLLGHNLMTVEDRFLEIPRTCELRPVTDDMALCHPTLQQQDGKLWVTDAEDAWFVRVNHIDAYGTDMDLEKLTAVPKEPLLFLNIDAVPGSRALLWEHIEDEPGKACPNPRVVLPRKIVPGVVNQPVGVDIRSLGVRTPPCTRANPSFGILGMFHVLPPALAWLWRLVAPRGYANPSIVSGGDLGSEGVGSYWPFATGKRVAQANLLLQQILDTPKTRYILTPNQHIGSWRVGFMPQWIARDYLARRGNARFREGQLVPARCPLLGHAVYSMRVEGVQITHWFLQTETQPEIGEEGYDRGAAILRDFFARVLKQFADPDLMPVGQEIIRCCLKGGKVEDFAAIIPQG